MIISRKTTTGFGHQPVRSPANHYAVPDTLSAMSFARISTKVDGPKLRRLRESLGWTQEMAAERSGYSCRLIRKLESGGPVDCQTLSDVMEAYCEYARQAALPNLDQFFPRETADWGHAAESWLRAAYSRQDWASFQALLRPHVQLAANGRLYRGEQAVLKRYEALVAAWKPCHFSLDQLFEDEGRVAIYWRCQSAADPKTLFDNPAKAVHEGAGPGSEALRNVHGNTFFVFRTNGIAQIREFVAFEADDYSGV